MVYEFVNKSNRRWGGLSRMETCYTLFCMYLRARIPNREIINDKIMVDVEVDALVSYRTLAYPVMMKNELQKIEKRLKKSAEQARQMDLNDGVNQSVVNELIEFFE